MKTLLALLTVLVSSQSFADGFVCETYNSDLRIKVYNKTQPTEGTRNAAIMIVSDPNVSLGRKTIATFSSEGTLENTGASYLADVDLRRLESDRKGENILSTKLGQIKSISLEVSFNYNHPVAEGTVLPGRVTVEKRNSEVIVEKLDCVRYLKGE